MVTPRYAEAPYTWEGTGLPDREDQSRLLTLLDLGASQVCGSYALVVAVAPVLLVVLLVSCLGGMAPRGWRQGCGRRGCHPLRR